MVESIKQENYQISTFLDLQKTLQSYLRQAYDVDGVWKIEEKKRQLNNGLVAIATETLSVRKKLILKLDGSATNLIRSFESPPDMLEPRRVFIDGYSYRELEEEEYLESLGFFDELPDGWPQGQGAGLTSADTITWTRAYYWDIGERIMRITPKIDTLSTALIWYAAMPSKLVEDDDIPDIHPAFSHLAAAWAAHKLLYKDEEQKDRGARALLDYESGISKFERFKTHKTSNRVLNFKKDKRQFKSRKRSFSTKYDLGRNFDL